MKKVNQIPISRISELIAPNDDVRIRVCDTGIYISLTSHRPAGNDTHYFPSLEDLEMYLMTDAKRCGNVYVQNH